MLIPRSHCGSQLAAFVLHCETVFWGHVQWLSRHGEEVQLLDNDCQEEEDFISCNDLADATALSQAKNQHLLPFQLVELSAVSTQEAVWVEGGWIFPQLRIMVDLPLIDEDTCVFRNEEAIQRCVFCGAVWDSEGQE